jgi:hypothetical protein
VREKRAARGTSPRAELRARLTAADKASAAGNAHDLDAATVRAIEAATIAGCRVNVRGIATSSVSSALAAAGVSEETARTLEELLRACEAARFSAGADDGQAAAAAQSRWAEARRAIEQVAGATA